MQAIDVSTHIHTLIERVWEFWSDYEEMPS